MKITFEIDDNQAVADALDAVVLSYLKNSKVQLLTWESTHEDDITHDLKVLEALNVMIEYYGG